MIIRAVVQAVLAIAVLQVYPADIATVERHAVFPEAGDRRLVEAAIFKDIPSFPLAEASHRAPENIQPTSLGVVTSAISAMVIDRESGKVLFQKNADISRSIGSIVKLMTAVVFLETEPNLNAPASLEYQDIRYGGRQYLIVGDGLRVEDILHASLIGSDNSSTAALVRLSGLTPEAFTGRMNEIAQEWGMTGTTFVDETGLSSDNRSVASDVAILVNEALKNELILEITQTPSATLVGNSGRYYGIKSTDELLTSFLNKPPYKILGGKTGFLPAAGYCFGAVISEDDGHEIIVVVLGSSTKAARFQDAKALAAWTYKTHEWPDERVNNAEEI